MSRTVPAAILATLGEKQVEPFYAIRIGLDGTPLRLWTGRGDRTILSETYTGGGSFIGIEGLEEAADLSAKNITLTLTGIDSSVVSLALQEPYQRRPVRVFWGVRSVSDVVEVFAGSLNTMTIEDGPESGTISVTVDSKLVELEKASNQRYTSESHKSRHPGDTFFDFVARIQDKQIVFESR